MSKETKSNSLFGTELNGFKKKQVNEYIASLERKHRESLAAYDSKIKNLEDALAAADAEHAALLQQFHDLQGEKAKVADVLINAEKSASAIVENARKEAENEKIILSDEAEKLRQAVIKRNIELRNLRNESERLLDKILEDVAEATAQFEEMIYSGRERLSASVDYIGKEYGVCHDDYDDEAAAEDYEDDADDAKVSFGDAEMCEPGGSEPDVDFSSGDGESGITFDGVDISSVGASEASDEAE